MIYAVIVEWRLERSESYHKNESAARARACYEALMVSKESARDLLSLRVVAGYFDDDDEFQELAIIHEYLDSLLEEQQ